MTWDAVIVGSGFGGAMAAHRLVEAGARVLMIERGDWVPRGDAAWRPEASLELTESYAKDIPYRCDRNGHGPIIGGYACVGGPSVYYGCVAFRFRERDFMGDPDVVGRSGAAWPFGYDAIEPYYGEAERLLGIAGDDAGDPTAPRRSGPFPYAPAPLAPITQRVVVAAAELGLSPFHLPLAINHTATAARRACIACRTCDTYACAIEAKNDVATTMIAPLVARGMTLWPRTVALRLEAEGGRVRRLHVFRKDTGETEAIEAARFVLAAGALGTPHLVLASGLEALSPARAAVGRYLMRHDNAMLFGFFPARPDPDRRFHKQVAIHDWYFGDPGSDDVPDLGKLGGVQQMMTPPKELVRAHLPLGTKGVIGALTEHLTGLLCIAEDQPRAENGVAVDWGVRDVYGLPQLVIDHGYSERDRRASDALARRARHLLERLGAIFVHTHRVKTFSHAVGTVRMGRDAATAPLDENCRFRGLANLWITDGSALPMSAGVNPSLTIAANALRVGGAIAA
ncbi:MAG TPA: GMC family oxidoreductase [Kofleriaceae bacterium]|nr:GMC family oxidoreductase [Kofleriaceae bacterium]